MAGILGFGNHENNNDESDSNNNNGNNNNNSNLNSDEDHHHQSYSYSNRRGFSVQVPVDNKAHQIGPILIPCVAGDGGLQVYLSYISFRFVFRNYVYMIYCLMVTLVAVTELIVLDK